jgi:hypothetical protein
MRKATIFAGAIGSLMTFSAYAQTTAPAAAPATAPQVQQAAPADDPDERICKSGEPILGSRFPGPRVCHTRKEWDQIQRDSQQELYREQMQRGSNPQ